MRFLNEQNYIVLKSLQREKGANKTTQRRKLEVPIKLWGLDGVMSGPHVCVPSLEDDGESLEEVKDTVSLGGT